MPSFAPIAVEEFQDRTGILRGELAPLWDSARKIIALRDIVKMESVLAMPRDYLTKLVAGIGLTGDPSAKPYASCDLQLMRLDPHTVQVAQTFVERKKYNTILENISDLFEGFCVTRGIAKLNACIVLGRDAAGELCIAHYVPPLVEEHAGRLILLDGTHRSFLIKAIGTTIEAILVRGVRTPFPCVPQEWSAVRKVDQKPPKEDRFVDLKPEYFRDVKYIGIDG